MITEDNEIIKRIKKLEKRLENLEQNLLTSPNSDDELLDMIIKIIRKDDLISPAFIQRKFKMGYARAARIIDQLENKGYIAQRDGSKPRKVIKSYLSK